jgi:hypothetical protein
MKSHDVSSANGNQSIDPCKALHIELSISVNTPHSDRYWEETAFRETWTMHKHWNGDMDFHCL